MLAKTRSGRPQSSGCSRLPVDLRNDWLSSCQQEKAAGPICSGVHVIARRSEAIWYAVYPTERLATIARGIEEVDGGAASDPVTARPTVIARLLAAGKIASAESTTKAAW